MLVLEKVSKVFVADTIETQALSDISVTIRKGEFVAVTGPSGSGKSTFLNIAGLLDTIDGGTQKIDGMDVSHLSDSQRAKIRRSMIGFIFQGFNLLPDLSIEDNVALPLRFQGMNKKERDDRVRAAITKVGLGTRMTHYPSQLSGGQQQRAAIARALAGDPKIILADEPTGNLDSKMSFQIMELLHEIHQAGSTIVMVTHNEEHAKNTPRVISIRDGKVHSDNAETIIQPKVQTARSHSESELQVEA